MSDAEWDADDFEPDFESKKSGPVTDKWDGEDEEDDIKDSWDKSDEEDKSKGEEESTVKAVQRKKKKKLADIIAEKEAAKQAEVEAAAAKKATNTPEAKLTEKVRQMKIEESANLELAKDMFGLKSGSIDSMVPVQKEEFAEFEKALLEKIVLFKDSTHYGDFVESLVKGLCLDLNATTLKKIKMNTEALHSTKLKEEKAKSKKKPPAKGALRMDLDRDMYADTGGYDDMEDFM